MDKRESKTKFHIVHSVKGGCGKTTFSLMKSIERAMQHDVNEKSEARVLYLDCDFRGSAIKALLYGVGIGKNCDEILLRPDKMQGTSYSKEMGGKSGSNYISLNEDYAWGTLNDFIRQDKNHIEDILVHGYTYKDLHEQTLKGALKGAIEDRYIINSKIDFIFSSSDSKDKDCFNHSMHSNNATMIDIGIFRLRIKTLLEMIVRYGKLNNSEPYYTDVIIDMPPGSDEYANALLEEIREFVGENDKYVEEEYYNMTTIDRGHIYATAEHIADLLGGSKKNTNIGKIHCVFTELSENRFGEDLNIVKENKRRIQDKLNEQNLESSSLNWWVNRYSKEYYESSRSSEYIKFTYNIQELN